VSFSAELMPAITECQPADLGDLEAMYATFQPLGAANGLPPVRTDQRRRWLRHLGVSADSLLARDPKGAVIGHAVLAQSTEGEAELAVFVHQESRGKRVGTALTGAAVDLARRRGYRRLWAALSRGNERAIQMVKRHGFHRATDGGGGDVEMEVILS
jgi:GNAT superfamily N-acetyltransferase